MVKFKTRSGQNVSFSTSGRKKNKGKSTMSAANRRKMRRLAKSRPRFTSGPKKGQFK